VGLFERGTVPAPVEVGKLYAIVRHDGLSVGRGHSWKDFAGGSMESYLARLQRAGRDPSKILPEWALGKYRGILD
jgi:hypothetical protein